MGSSPLTIFNASNFGIFEYKESLQSYDVLPVTDEESLASKMPKNFKAVYLGDANECYLIAGGFDT
jgi:hypothetical protein